MTGVVDSAKIAGMAKYRKHKCKKKKKEKCGMETGDMEHPFLMRFIVLFVGVLALLSSHSYYRRAWNRLLN